MATISKKHKTTDISRNLQIVIFMALAFFVTVLFISYGDSRHDESQLAEPVTIEQ